jgi:hypothetical protein
VGGGCLNSWQTSPLARRVGDIDPAQAGEVWKRSPADDGGEGYAACMRLYTGTLTPASTITATDTMRPLWRTTAMERRPRTPAARRQATAQHSGAGFVSLVLPILLVPLTLVDRFANPECADGAD